MEGEDGSRWEGDRPLLGGEAGSFPWGRNAGLRRWTELVASVLRST